MFSTISAWGSVKKTPKLYICVFCHVFSAFFPLDIRFKKHNKQKNPTCFKFVMVLIFKSKT